MIKYQGIDYKQLYQDGVSSGAIDPEIASYKQWVRKNEEEFMPIYQEGIEQDVFEKFLSYSEWIKLNNYGQPPN
ncbi:hypothetical protein J14TS2_42140 [Bacillus sp. J14TS2]|uniref:hypothetical protein n=1 Tax=Bacillus sp. J14TS2 TaxID=2807188 RepID=UPI001B0B432D|nr:hypothetical protein [Bacillus sp. J14TS2]GIN73739.1 hypothetical protein J14TS2_42140 [Bacillus sp. J14TS2]